MCRAAARFQAGRVPAGGVEARRTSLNLGRWKEAQNLLMQTARERRADMLLISE